MSLAQGVRRLLRPKAEERKHVHRQRHDAQHVQALLEVPVQHRRSAAKRASMKRASLADFLARFVSCIALFDAAVTPQARPRSRQPAMQDGNRLEAVLVRFACECGAILRLEAGHPADTFCSACGRPIPLRFGSNRVEPDRTVGFEILEPEESGSELRASPDRANAALARYLDRLVEYSMVAVQLVADKLTAEESGCVVESIRRAKETQRDASGAEDLQERVKEMGEAAAILEAAVSCSPDCAFGLSKRS